MGGIFDFVVSAFEGAAYAAMIVVGFACYLATKKTPMFAHQSMIRLFCLTSGHSNDWISASIGFFKRPYCFRSAGGVIGEMAEPASRDQALRALRESGYHLFERRLSGDVCAVAGLHPRLYSRPCV